MENEEALRRKNEILMYILENAIAELLEGASPEYREEVFEIIGTSEEELKELGFSIVE